MKLFIDANIYLNYFRRSDVSLSSLKVLKTLLRQKKLTLVLPAQTRDEYFRNRNRIAEQSRELLLRETDLKLTFPAPFVAAWPEALSVRRHVEGTRKAYQKLLKKYDATVSVENTPADKLIGQLFASAELLRDDEDTVRRAYFRYLRGHPPRKNDGSFGDAIAWELLLSSASDDLVLITRDGDFSERRRGIVSVNGFLEREWHAKHQGKKVEIYESLGEFINSFEKRRAVKNEVVEKEKSSLLNAILAYPSGPGGSFLSGNVLGTPNTVSYVMGGGTPVFTKAGTLTNLNSIFQAPNTVSYLIGGGTPFLATPETVSFVGQNANPFLTGPISQSSQERNTAAKLCPNCKGDLEIALKEALKSSSTADRPSKFACPHCNCEIDPAKLD